MVQEKEMKSSKKEIFVDEKSLSDIKQDKTIFTKSRACAIVAKIFGTLIHLQWKNVYRNTYYYRNGRAGHHYFKQYTSVTKKSRMKVKKESIVYI